MNKILYNQLSEKLYKEYCKAKFNNHHVKFAYDLAIEPKIVALFDELYKNEENIDGDIGLITHGIFKSIRAMFPQQPVLHINSEMSLAERGRLFAIQSHREVDQIYGDDRDEIPYEYHLWAAVQFFHKYKHHIPKEHWDAVEAAIWNHDVVEDGHRTYNNLKEATCEMTARIACACTTNLHGINRKARADAAYYQRLNETQYAGFAKLCDRLANIANGGKMVDGYRKEMPDFLKALAPSTSQYTDMIFELNELVGLVAA